MLKTRKILKRLGPAAHLPAPSFPASLLAGVLAALLVITSLGHAAAEQVKCGHPALSSTSDPSDNGLLLRVRAKSESTLLSKRGRPYRIVVSSPEGPEPVGGFPVIYVLEADAWLGMAEEIAKMREYEKLPPPILVGIAYPSHFFFDPEGRSLDFTPPGSVDSESREAGLEVGGADQFLSFLNETLEPWVRRHYRINPRCETLYGHSLGGLFVLYTMFKAPESFNTYLAASPSIWFSDKILLKHESAFEANSSRKNLRILLTVGELESHLSSALEADYRRYYSVHPEAIPGQTVSEVIAAMRKDSASSDMVGDAHNLADRLAKSGVKVTFVEFAGEEHMSAAVSALNRGVPFALRPDHSPFAKR
jgi:predicted alpha/beta superfamily hydrolase